MPNQSATSLGALRLQTKQRADMETDPSITDTEWNQYISQSYKELYDLLIGAYGNDYFISPPYRFVTTNAQSYALPDGSTSYTDSTGSTASKFYKLVGVDLQYSGSPNGFVALRNFNFIERNKFAYPNSTVSFRGYTNLRYRLQGNNLFITPVPQIGQTIQVWYIPAPTPISYMLPVTSILSSTTVNISETYGLTVGMNVVGDNIPTGTTITSIASTSFVMSNQATSGRVNTIYSFYNDAASIDGIAGWEEYIVVDAAMKGKIKNEEEVSSLAMQKEEMKKRIESMAEGRDAGQPFKVSDTLGANNFGGDMFSSYGSDDGWW